MRRLWDSSTTDSALRLPISFEFNKWEPAERVINVLLKYVKNDYIQPEYLAISIKFWLFKNF